MRPLKDGVASREYTISDLAGRYGLSHRTLRFYEEKDLLHPARRGGLRVFSEDDRVRLDIIVLARRLRFTLAETWKLIQSRVDAPKDEARPSVSSLGLSSAQIWAHVEHLMREREGVQRAIEELRAAAARDEKPEAGGSDRGA